MAYLFILCLLVPLELNLGPLVLYPHRLVLLILTPVALYHVFVRRVAGGTILPDWLLLFSALWSVLSFFVNAPDLSAIETGGSYFLEFTGAYFLARTSVRSAGDMARIARLLLLTLVVLVPAAAIESVTGRAFLLQMIPVDTYAVVYTQERMGLRRAQVVFAHPIHFGVYASISLALFYFMFGTARRIAGSLLSAVGTFLSLSTGALAAFMVQVALIAWNTVFARLASRWYVLIGLSVAGYVVLDLLSNRTPFHLIVDYMTFNSGSSYNRILIWRYGTESVAAHPLFGIGLGEWARPSWMGSSVDNFWLLLAMRNGVPAFVATFLTLSLLAFKSCRTRLSKPENIRARYAYVFVVTAIVLAGGTVHFWSAMMSFVMFMVGAGAWLVRFTEDATEENEAEVSAPVSRYTRQSTRRIRGS
ncbi:O-antigen ligase family protein [Ovoidimarina sediminis]|uniref:O-antigen ligase family protein n=1 Tax=Ovoidimarina sediminis TaxID=3079856 RepID=UPI00292DFAB7|nr:O-antigen ligase family protein [Rhodophyticola sp. MJ-SS7]